MFWFSINRNTDRIEVLQFLIRRKLDMMSSLVDIKELVYRELLNAKSVYVCRVDHRVNQI